MKATMQPIRLLAFSASLALWSLSAGAGTISIELAEGEAGRVMEEEGETYVNAMKAIIAKHKPTLFEGGTANFKHFNLKANSDTLAVIEYTYTDTSGQSVTRRYHSRSGRPTRTLIDKAPSDSSSSSTGPTDEERARDIAMDAEESEYYAYSSDLDVRASVLPAENSILEATDLGDFSRANDAELKAFRRIEADIASGNVTRGGTIKGYVSQSVCESCRKVVTTFAEEFDASGAIYQLLGANADYLPDAADGFQLQGAELAESIKNSRAAAAMQREARKAYSKATLRPAPREKAARGPSKRSVQRMAEATRGAAERQAQATEIEGC